MCLELLKRENGKGKKLQAMNGDQLCIAIVTCSYRCKYAVLEAKFPFVVVLRFWSHTSFWCAARVCAAPGHATLSCSQYL
jgi:hypothetical protein